MAITDQLCCSMRQLIHSTNHTEFTVRQTTHTIVGMHPDTRTCINRFFSFFKSSIGVSQSDSHSFSCNSPNKFFHPFTLRSKGNLIQQTIGSFLPSPEFFHTWILHIRWVLSSLVFFCKIRSFKINPANLSSCCFFVSCTDIFRYCQKLFVRGSKGRRQKARNPCTQEPFTHGMESAFDIVIHHIYPTKSVNMGIYEARRNAVTRIIQHIRTFW